MNEHSQERGARETGTDIVDPGYRSGAIRRSGAGTAIALGYDGVGTDEATGYLQLWRTILKWRWVVLGVFAAVVALAVLITFLTTPVYRARATLEVASEELKIIDTADSASSSVSMARADYMQTQYALLESRSMAERVARALNLGSQAGFGFPAGGTPNRNPAAALSRATKVLADDLKVAPVGQSRLIAVTFESTNPGAARRVVNGYASEFIASTLDRASGSTTQTRDILQQRLADAKAKLEQAERAATAYARSAGIINVQSSSADGDPGSTSLDAASLSELNTALATAQQERIAAQERFRQSSNTTTEELTNPTIQALLSRRAELTAEISQKASIYRDDFPEMQQLRARIADIDASIAREKGRIRTALTSEYIVPLRRAKARCNRASTGSRGVCSTSTTAAFSIISCGVRWIPTANSTMRCSTATSRSMPRAIPARATCRWSIPRSRRSRCVRTRCSTSVLAPCSGSCSD